MLRKKIEKMNDFMAEVGHKAEILIDALPYIRDFNQKIIVIEYGCSEWLDAMAEKSLMQDIALLKSVGMRPIVVHDTRMGMDKFRENKRIAKLIELCGPKALGVCGIDVQTLNMTLNNGYIPVIVPNDVDTETMYINPEETAMEVAVRMAADKLVYLSKNADEAYGALTLDDIKSGRAKRALPDELHRQMRLGETAIEAGVNRVHMLDGRIKHCLLLELFSVHGVGAMLIRDRKHLYAHEK